MGKDEMATGQMTHLGEMPRPQYVPPKIVTYTGEQIAERIGPAHACSPGPCPTTP
jgi:hypothetical protein